MIPPIQQHESPKPVRARDQALCAAIWAILIAALTLLYFRDPTKVGFLPSCMFHDLTGLNCPGCGSTRAMHHLVHLRLATAFGFNPLLFVALPFLAYSLLSFTSLTIRGKRLPAPFLRSQTILSILVLLIAYWILRNIPVYPFTLLAP